MLSAQQRQHRRHGLRSGLAIEALLKLFVQRALPTVVGGDDLHLYARCQPHLQHRRASAAVATVATVVVTRDSLVVVRMGWRRGCLEATQSAMTHKNTEVSPPRYRFDSY